MDTVIWILLAIVLFYIIAGFNKEVLRRWDEKIKQKEESLKEAKEQTKDKK